MEDSKKFTLNVNDVKNIGRDALLVGVAAALAFLGENVADLDLGASGVMLVPVITVAIDTLIKYVKDNVRTA